MQITGQIISLVGSFYPDLVARVRQHVEDSEARVSDKGLTGRDSFLWEHTLHVAALTAQICLLERCDPLLPVVAALFHDAGKFTGGFYHYDERPEENIAADIAQKLLADAGMDKSGINDVTAGLRALYHDDQFENRMANILHDADFLAKTGWLGIANFFIKGTLRGQNLQSTLIQSLSKELTYASILAENMRTKAGRSMAAEKSRKTIRYFRGLLEELRNHGIVRFNIDETSWPCPKNSQKKLKIMMAIPEECPRCGGSFTPTYSTDSGIKCTSLVAEITCDNCPETYRISFCLPEICT